MNSFSLAAGQGNGEHQPADRARKASPCLNLLRLLHQGGSAAEEKKPPKSRTTARRRAVPLGSRDARRTSPRQFPPSMSRARTATVSPVAWSDTGYHVETQVPHRSEIGPTVTGRFSSKAGRKPGSISSYTSPGGDFAVPRALAVPSRRKQKMVPSDGCPTRGNGLLPGKAWRAARKMFLEAPVLRKAKVIFREPERALNWSSWMVSLRRRVCRSRSSLMKSVGAFLHFSIGRYRPPPGRAPRRREGIQRTGTGPKPPAELNPFIRTWSFQIHIFTSLFLGRNRLSYPLIPPAGIVKNGAKYQL